jgi:hypothetical protein
MNTERVLNFVILLAVLLFLGFTIKTCSEGIVVIDYNLLEYVCNQKGGVLENHRCYRELIHIDPSEYAK